MEQRGGPPPRALAVEVNVAVFYLEGRCPPRAFGVRVSVTVAHVAFALVAGRGAGIARCVAGEWPTGACRGAARRTDRNNGASGNSAQRMSVVGTRTLPRCRRGFARNARRSPRRSTWRPRRRKRTSARPLCHTSLGPASGGCRLRPLLLGSELAVHACAHRIAAGRQGRQENGPSPAASGVVAGTAGDQPRRGRAEHWGSTRG